MCFWTIRFCPLRDVDIDDKWIAMCRLTHSVDAFSIRGGKKIDFHKVVLLLPDRGVEFGRVWVD